MDTRLQNLLKGWVNARLVLAHEILADREVAQAIPMTVTRLANLEADIHGRKLSVALVHTRLRMVEFDIDFELRHSKWERKDIDTADLFSTLEEHADAPDSGPEDPGTLVTAAPLPAP